VQTYNNLQKTAYQLMAVPFSWVNVRGPSIVDDIPWGVLVEIGVLMLLGDADVVQVGWAVVVARLPAFLLTCSSAACPPARMPACMPACLAA